MNEEVMLIKAKGLNEFGMIECENYQVYPGELDDICGCNIIANEIGGDCKITKNFVIVKNNEVFF